MRVSALDFGLLKRIRTALLLFALLAASAQASALARLAASPAAGESLRAGATTTLRFAVEEEIEEMEVLLSLDGGRSFPIRVTREMAEGTHQLEWRVPNLPTTRARLALRVGSERDGEVIRAVSAEFSILASGTEPLEEIRMFCGEWRAGEALEEIPSPSPFEAAGLGASGESIRAERPETDLDRPTAAAAPEAPAGGGPYSVELSRTSPPPRSVSSRTPRNLPRRE